MADEFSRAVCTIAVAHILKSVGFESVQNSAAETLIEVMQNYIERIGSTAKDLAELSCRTKPTIIEVLQAFQEIAPPSFDLKELVKALDVALPFDRDIEEFPIRRKRLYDSSQDEVVIGKREPLPPHVPQFMPPLPNHHTYSHSKIDVVKRETDEKKIRIEMLKQKRQAQLSLNELQRGKYNSPTKSNFATNPFLLPPKILHFKNDELSKGQKEIFTSPAESFEPAPIDVHKPSHSMLDHGSTGIAKTQNAFRQDASKEDKILAGTFYDGDSD